MKLKIPASIIKSFLVDNFDAVKETSTGELRVNSPFAFDNKFHLYINPEKGVVHDFKTDYGADFVSFVAEFLQINKTNATTHLIKNYSGRSHITDFSLSEYIETSAELEIPKDLKFFSQQKHGIMRRIAYSYLDRRGIPKKIINDLGYIYNQESEYNKTIFVPFYENGELVYFITRDFTNKNVIRYNNPRGLNSKKFVYNIDEIEDTVFIFEGVFDALMLENQVGTAMLSADLGKEQAVKILSKAPKNIIFVPDNDETGMNTLEKNINLFLKYKPPSLDINIFVYYIKKAKDFGETGKNSIDISECIIWKKRDLTRLFQK